jgi:hypothetical protein
MMSMLIRKASTLLNVVDDFNRDPLASFANLDEGLKDRCVPIHRSVLERVVESYRAAKRDQQTAGDGHMPNGEWTTLIQDKDSAFAGDNMGTLLENFFRDDRTSSGLCEYAPWSKLTQSRQFMMRMGFINAMLHDFKTWQTLTGEGMEAAQTLTVGNSWGYVIEGKLAAPACFRHHLMTKRALHLMGGKGVLAELGGGWGDVAFFALKSPGVHYLDFDLPEVLLLASYWLCSGLPNKKIALYGEADSKQVLRNIADYDAVLFPHFCFQDLPDRSADVFLNARSLSEMDSQTIENYLGHISRTCKSYFLHDNSDVPHRQLGHTEVPASSFQIADFALLNKGLSPWKSGGGRYREFLYERYSA